MLVFYNSSDFKLQIRVALNYSRVASYKRGYYNFSILQSFNTGEGDAKEVLNDWQWVGWGWGWLLINLVVVRFWECIN